MRKLIIALVLAASCQAAVASEQTLLWTWSPPQQQWVTRGNLMDADICKGILENNAPHAMPVMCSMEKPSDKPTGVGEMNQMWVWSETRNSWTSTDPDTGIDPVECQQFVQWYTFKYPHANKLTCSVEQPTKPPRRAK